jgi:hypothetical protein
MSFSAQINIKAMPEQIYVWYKNVSSWPIWDNDINSALLSNGLTLGAKGYLHPKKGPRINITITECTPNKSFTVQSKLPLCTMSFEHTLTENEHNTTVAHKVSFSGLLSPIFSFLIGRSIKKSLPNTLTTLKNTIEKNHK